MKLFLIPSRLYSKLSDMRTAVDLVKEYGGRVVGIAPFNMGFVVETSDVIADNLCFVAWN